MIILITMIKLIMPTFIEMWVKKKRRYSINLNTYRNLHFQVNNNLKKMYKEMVKRKIIAFGNIKIPKTSTPVSLTLLKKIYKKMIKNKIAAFENIKIPKISAPVSLTLTYFNGTKRKSDLENNCIIHVKYLLDALVELWVIPTDDYDTVKKIVFI